MRVIATRTERDTDKLENTVKVRTALKQGSMALPTAGSRWKAPTSRCFAPSAKFLQRYRLSNAPSSHETNSSGPQAGIGAARKGSPHASSGRPVPQFPPRYSGSSRRRYARKQGPQRLLTTQL